MYEEDQDQMLEDQVIDGQEVPEDETQPEQPEQAVEAEPHAPDEPAKAEESILNESTNDTELVKKLRKLVREKSQEAARLRRSIPQEQATEIQAPRKPKIDEFDFDTDKYEAAMDSYYTKKAEYDKRTAEANREAEERNNAWQQRVQTYTAERQKLNSPEMQESEAMVQEIFDVVQQTAILQGFDNAASLVLKIGRDFDEMERLAKIKDPIRFALAVQEYNLKTKGIQMSKKPPAPEKTVQSGASAGSDQSRKLEQLREQAQKTGDYTAYMQFKRTLKK